MVAELWLAGTAQLLFATGWVEELVCRQLPRGTWPWEMQVRCACLLRSKAPSPKEGGGLSENYPATCKCSFLQDPKEPFPSFLASTAGSSQPVWSSAISILQMSHTVLLGSEGFPWRPDVL